MGLTDTKATRYVALLRAINVGGKGVVKMAALRDCFERAGMTRVTTYIQSGNIIFDTRERAAGPVIRRLEGALSRTFGYNSAIVVRSHTQFADVLAGAPRDWPRGKHLRRYVAFLRAPVTAAEALKEVEPRDGVDVVTAGKGVLYMSTVLGALSRSGLTKVVGKRIYQDMTIRSYSTCLRILDLMNEP